MRNSATCWRFSATAASDNHPLRHTILPKIMKSVIPVHSAPLLRKLGFAIVIFTAGLLPTRAEFKAGAVAVDITPTKLPVLVNGGMLSHTVGKVKTPIHARAVAFADGKEQLVIVVVDSCMMTRQLLDE